MQIRVWVTVLSLIAAGALACEPGEGIEIVNGTEEVIMISQRSDRRTVVEPGDSLIIGTRRGRGTGFTVYDNDNVPLVEFGFSWEEFQEMDFHFTIKDADLRVSE